MRPCGEGYGFLFFCFFSSFFFFFGFGLLGVWSLRVSAVSVQGWGVGFPGLDVGSWGVGFGFWDLGCLLFGFWGVWCLSGPGRGHNDVSGCPRDTGQE